MKDLNKFKNEMNLSGQNVYVGHRYVPKIFGEWDNSKLYEPLSIVQYQGASYTSRQYVPVGVEITNEDFWAVTGNYNAQIEQYRQEVKEFDNRISDNELDIENTNEKLAQTHINVKEMGAAGDGVTDDSHIIQNAIDLAGSTGESATVYIPKGDYLIDTEILVDVREVNIIGDGRQSRLIAGDNLTRAMFYSSTNERTKVSTLLDVRFKNLNLVGLGKNIYGVLFAGFNRGCSISECIVDGFLKAQIFIVNSWSFIIEKNIIRGHYVWAEDGLSRVYYGDGIVLGSPTENVMMGEERVTINIPNVHSNSIQFANSGIRWSHGAGGSITGNTIENVNVYTVFQMVKGFEYTGNYMEACKGSHGVVLGGESVGYEVNGAIIEGNEFMPRSSGQIDDIQIIQIKNVRIKNNHHSESEYGVDIITSSTMSTENVFGNTLLVKAGKLSENVEINRLLNDVKFYSENPTENTMGSIIESGSGVNGNYIRFSDGTQICYRNAALDLTTTDIQEFQWEKNFTTLQTSNEIIRTFNVRGNSAQRTEFRKTSGLMLASSNYWSLSIGAVNGATGTIDIALTAIGKWK